MTWRVGSAQTNGALIQLDGVEVSTGTATVAYVRHTAGADDFLQSDATSWGAAAYAFPAPRVAGRGFFHELTVPQSADGYTVEFTITHSAFGAVYSESHVVDVGAGAGGLEIELRP